MNGAAWQTYPGAPAPGTSLARVQDVPARGLLSLDLDGFPVLIVRTPDGMRAYVNACPHQYLPLDWRSPSILSADGTQLRCSNHDWAFDASTGAGQGEDSAGCALDPVPLTVIGDRIVIGTAGT